MKAAGDRPKRRSRRRRKPLQTKKGKPKREIHLDSRAAVERSQRPIRAVHLHRPVRLYADGRVPLDSGVPPERAAADACAAAATRACAAAARAVPRRIHLYRHGRLPLGHALQVTPEGALYAPPEFKSMTHNEEMKSGAWTPYREVIRYRRLLLLSTLLNLVLAAALFHCLR